MGRPHWTWWHWAIGCGTKDGHNKNGARNSPPNYLSRQENYLASSPALVRPILLGVSSACCNHPCFHPKLWPA